LNTVGTGIGKRGGREKRLILVKKNRQTSRKERQGNKVITAKLSWGQKTRGNVKKILKNAGETKGVETIIFTGRGVIEKKGEKWAREPIFEKNY